jgi:threonine dehydratase
LALAAVLAEGERVAGRKVAMILTGGNCDLDVLEAAARR